MACTGVACIVMACMVMACMVMAHIGQLPLRRQALGPRNGTAAAREVGYAHALARSSRDPTVCSATADGVSRAYKAWCPVVQGLVSRRTRPGVPPYKALCPVLQGPVSRLTRPCVPPYKVPCPVLQGPVSRLTRPCVPPYKALCPVLLVLTRRAIQRCARPPPTACLEHAYRPAGVPLTGSGNILVMA